MAAADRRVALITGASAGIGRAVAIELARAGLAVVLAGRHRERNAAAAREVRAAGGHEDVHTIDLDLASLASVRAAAAAFLALGRPLHVLIANAGLAGVRGLTEDGFELTFAVNHLGHYLLTRALLDRLRASSPARIVVVASRAHYRARRLDFDAVRRPARPPGLAAYRASKLANVLFAAELARRLQGTGVDAYAVHPGVIASEIWREIPWPVRPAITRFMRSVEEGARPVVHVALAADAGVPSGAYVEAEGPRAPSTLATDPALAAELWRRSAIWTEADARPVAGAAAGGRAQEEVPTRGVGT
jgi:retinol dehydrogenase 12